MLRIGVLPLFHLPEDEDDHLSLLELEIRPDSWAEKLTVREVFYSQLDLRVIFAAVFRPRQVA